ncbi:MULTISPECIES: TonB-dependent receptor [unclassified Imperialibacter]|uniref:SusC/RagA family TonB-linked outer membrane protein n=1 Tax=unclassified Imperialibacter TaxID=2629706 RepID=UPI00125A88EF|nr:MULTISPECIES: TonB-dependent receptor [unclassified Imperialibacter]CAD5282252.1 TonB-dependent receptor [Imperialibacter sp. 89]CAD5287371.1 TonB-dependent receptor [Imperialibacter sp. 75]VVT30626.1 TonB-linked outer membrane protein, SusC/RagA family [Imperialibacter sp. EC-SDR9]
MKHTLRLASVVLFIVMSMGSQATAVAQASVVKGKVTSQDDGEGLPGVSIQVEGTSRGTVTDFEGTYSLELQSGDNKLIYSFIGYKTVTVDVGSRSVIDLVMEPDIEQLEEIVVVGYGVQRKSDVTGAVASVRGADLTKIPAANPMQALQGKVAGVQVSSGSGQPGAAPVVRIRGVGTFNDSSPIYVVDGVILSDISFLNSSDIQSMEVLKDASATAIYGSRGANGVVIITTKQGKIGDEKTTFSVNTEYSVQKLSKKIDLLNGKEFATVVNDISPGSYNNVDAVPNTDWQDLIFDVAPIQNHQVSATGATKKTQYYVGLGYFNQQGIIDKSKYERLTLKLNNTYKFSDNVRLGNNITVAPYSQQVAPGVVYQVYRAQPVAVPRYDDGSFGVVPNVGNPLADLENSNNFNKGLRTVGNVFTDIKLFKDFTFRSSFGVDMAYNKNKSFTPAYTVYNADGTASQQQNLYSDLSKENRENFTWLWENTLTYNKEFGKHRVEGLAGFTSQKTTSEYLSIRGENILRDGQDFWYLRPSYIVDESNNINTLNSIANGVDAGQYYSMASVLFRVNYTYDERFLFTGTFRRDGSSKFTDSNKYASFPSLALGWNVINESFMQNITALTNLKVRASWGAIGNEKIRYNRQFSLVQNELNPVFGVEEALNPGASYGVTGNPDLKWETTYQTDLGLEFGLLNQRLTGELDYYRRETQDILVDLLTPGHLGNGQGQRVTYNAGSVLNSGFEFNLGWSDEIQGVKYRIGALGSTVHNEVLSVGGNSGVDSTLVGGYLGDGRPVTLSREGLPIGAFYGYQIVGVFQNQAELDAYPHDSQARPGDLIIRDVNGDGKISLADRTYMGSPIPTFIYGFNLEASYKGFDINVDFQGQMGNKIFNGKEVVRPDPYNFERHVINRWTGEGTSTTEPRASFGGINFAPSTRFIQDGSFLRFRNMTIGYTIPDAALERINMNQVRVYVRGTNLFTATKFTGYSPEFGSEDVLSSNIDRGAYPVSAIYSAGLNISF